MTSLIENQLIEVSLQIGQIAQANCHYTAGLAKKIQQTGKTVQQLTISELLYMNKQHTNSFNKAGR